MIAAAAHALSRQRGWTRLGIAFLAGVMATAALPPLHIVPALLIAFPVLLWLLDGSATARNAAVTGWAFGFGHFFSGFYWMANAFYVDSDAFGALALPAVGGLSAAFGIFTGIVAAATHMIRPAHADAMSDDRAYATAARVLLFAGIWTLVEWLRAWILTGLPWNLMATVWAETATPVGPAMIQSTSVFGSYGLSLLTVLAAAMTAVLGYAPRLRGAWIAAAVPVAALVVTGLGGAARLAMSEVTMAPGVKLRLVQPNISQADKWRPTLREQHLEDHVRLSLENRPADITHVIWSEAAVAFFLDRDEAHRRIAAAAAPANGLLITGVPRAEPDPSAGPSGYRVYNSLVAITADMRVTATYDKHHLVPFGEYVPLRGYIPIATLTAGAMDSNSGFTPGPGAATLNVDGLPPFSPLICYEVIFPHEIIASGAARPQWLLNLTNDAWYGISAGPYQHFAMARLRAVEQGLPMVRVAGTGISAVVDPYGGVRAKLDLATRGILDAPLPQGLVEPTPYGTLGDWIPLAMSAISIFAGWMVWRRCQRA